MTSPAGARQRHIGGDGEPTVFTADEQDDHPVDLSRLNRLALHVLVAEGVRGDCELNILFVGEDEIAGLNEVHMGTAGPTDVLAFPLDDELLSEPGRQPDGGTSGPERSVELADLPLLLGDVVVCPAVAARNAPDHAGTYEDELDLLVVHGTLHVLGWDHVGSEETSRMEARQQELLAAFEGGGDARAAEPDGPAGPGGRRR